MLRRANRRRGRMLRGEVFSKVRFIPVRASRRNLCDSGCIGLDHGMVCKMTLGPPCGHVPWDIDFLDEAQCSSIRPVACLNGARLERRLEG